MPPADLVDRLARADEADLDRLATESDIVLLRQVVRELYWRAEYSPRRGAEYPRDRIRAQVMLLSVQSGDGVIRGYAKLLGADPDKNLPAAAQPEIEGAIELFREAAFVQGEADAGRQLGRFLYGRADFSAAVDHLTRSAQIYAMAGDVVSRSPCLLDLGEALRAKGDLVRSRETILEAVEAYAALNDEVGGAHAVTALAAVEIALGRGADTELPLRQALDQFRRTGELEGERRALTNLGLLADRLGRPSEALAHYQAALERQGEETGSREVGLILNNIGVLELNAGMPRESLARFREAIAIAERSGDKDPARMALHNAGEAHRYCGEFGESLAVLERASELAGLMGLEAARAAVQGSMATVHEEIGELDRAEAIYRSILEVFERLGLPAEAATARLNLARLALVRGRPDSALVGIEQALADQRARQDWAGVGLSLRMLGDGWLASGDPEAAAEAYGESLFAGRSLDDPAMMARALIGLGAVHYGALRDSEAAESFGEALRLGDSSGSADVIVAAGTWLGHAHSRSGEVDQARQAYETAISSIEQSRVSLDPADQQSGFFEQNLNPYHGLARLDLESSDPISAWAAFERARARSLLQLMEEVGVDRSSPALFPGDAGAETDQGPAGARDSDGSAGWPELEGMIPDHRMALLQYEVLGEDLWLFTASRRKSEFGTGGIRVAGHRLDIAPGELGLRVGELLERCQKRSISPRLEEIRRELFDLLIQPALPDLGECEVMGLLPTDVLWHLPFAVLLDPSGRSLIERFALYEVPSIGTLNLIVDRQREKSSIEGRQPTGAGRSVVLADPDLSGVLPELADRYGGFGPIPFTRLQAESALRGGRAVTVYLGGDATEERVMGLGSGLEVLHLATHGVFDPFSPLRSGLLLTPGPTTDGLLEAREILEHGIHAELVVTGACRTALGRPRKGEGVQGLSWALLGAGSSSAILNLWSVDDASTAAFMELLYREMGGDRGLGRGSGSCDLARALQRAQLRLMAEGPDGHPFFWAGPVLIGSPH